MNDLDHRCPLCGKESKFIRTIKKELKEDYRNCNLLSESHSDRWTCKECGQSWGDSGFSVSDSGEKEKEICPYCGKESRLIRIRETERKEDYITGQPIFNFESESIVCEECGRAVGGWSSGKNYCDQGEEDAEKIISKKNKG